MDNGTKSPLASLGVWGGLLASASGLGSVLQYIDILKEGLPPIMTAGTALFGGLLAIYGRIRATRKIG